MKSFLNQLIECAIMLDNNKEVVFINDKFKKNVNFTSLEELKSRMEINNNIIKITYNNIVKIEGECAFKEVDFEGEKHYLSTVRFKEDTRQRLSSLEQEKMFLRENLSSKEIEEQAFDIINIVNRLENFEENIEEYGPTIFEIVRKSYGEYFKSEKFNIWIYDETTSSLKSYFYNESLNNDSEEEINIDKNRILNYLSGEYKPILNIKGDNLNCERNYIVRYPIIFCNEFLGELTISYNEFPINKVINSELLKTICNHIAFIIKYIQVSRDLREQVVINKKCKEEEDKQAKESLYLEELREEFFSNVSHEFKTPLTLIMASIQVLEHYIDDSSLEMTVETARKYLRTLKQNSYRLLRLINNIIDVNKINSGFYEVKPINTNIVEVVEDIVMSVVTYCNHKGINMVFNTDTEEIILACDPDQIERVMLNLLSNAMKYTDNGGDIMVDIKNNNSTVTISIEDTGKGMPQNKLSNIFDRFVQIEDKEAISKSGSGIGLALVKSIIELHNGEIKVESTEGIGTIFQITLPIKQVDSTNITVEIDRKEIENKLERYNIEFSDIYRIR